MFESSRAGGLRGSVGRKLRGIDDEVISYRFPGNVVLGSLVARAREGFVPLELALPRQVDV